MGITTSLSAPGASERPREHPVGSYVRTLRRMPRRLALRLGVSRDALSRRAVSAVALWCLSVLAAGVAVAWVLDLAGTTPQERALRLENRALRAHLAAVSERTDHLAARVDFLERVDRDIYRTLLREPALSEDVRQVGVGGSGVSASLGGIGLDRMSEPAAALVRRTAEQLDVLEREVELQGASYREVLRAALTRETRLHEMPALLPAEGPVVSGFGLRRHPILDVPKMHEGIDVLVPIGTPVVASGAGVVREVGRSASFGLYVELEHPHAGYRTFYAHLSSLADGVRRGVRVRRGEPIAYSGTSGRSTGPHLHFEVRDTSARAYDPIQFFAPSITPVRLAQMRAMADRATVSLD